MGMAITPLAGMRCQFCQKPISLLRRLSDPEFCSAQHREQFAQQEAELAMARLMPVVRQARGRGSKEAESAAAVAVLEPPPAPPPAITLASTIPWPPQQTRSYWCFALPADPILPPVGVMLQEPPLRWSARAPEWATSVVALWPVNRPPRRELEVPVAVAPLTCAVPASPLRPMPWILPNLEQIPDAVTALAPLRLPLGRRAVTGFAAEVPALPWPATVWYPRVSTPAAVGLGTCGSVEPAPLRPAVATGTMARPDLDPPAFSAADPQLGNSAVPFVSGTLPQEWHGYLRRMEQQLVRVAEQAGLCGRQPLPWLTSRSLPVEGHGAALPLPFPVERSWPEMPATIPALMIGIGGLRPLPALLPTVWGPTIQASEAPPLIAPPVLLWSLLPARPALQLCVGTLGAPPPGPRIAATIAATMGSAEPVPCLTFNWPPALASTPALVQSNQLVAVPEPRAHQALAIAQDPHVIPLEPPKPQTLAWPGLGSSAPLPAVQLPLAPPSPQRSVELAGIESQPLPAPPAVIVPGSGGTRLAKSSTSQPALFSLSHLFPGRRDQAVGSSRLETCPWRSKPVLPPTRLPRISLQERNATRARALQEVRQVLQKQTIDRARLFWRLAPADLKWLALALPVILGVWLWPKKTVSVSVPSPVTLVKPAVKSAVGNGYLEKVFQSNLNLGGFEERIASRSSIHLEEDFSAGLGLWDGEGNWARSWYYDKGGVIRPGRMAIYQPSIPMEDYQLLLTAAVERRSISWMVRASDLRNYIAARLHIAGSGPGQRLSFERWTVKEGRVIRRQVLPLATNLGTATTARIQMDITGTTFTTMLNDQVIDVFTDSSHPSGGVGLFSSDGDQPRIYRLVLTHQHDFFGKLCSFLAPHPITKAGTIRP